MSGGPYTTISTLGAVTSPAYLDLTAVNGTLYYYVVSALNGGGESLDSAPAAATPQPPAPGVPTGLTPTPGNSQVSLDWTAPSGTISSYNVKRGTVSGGPYTTISTLGAVTSPAYLDLTAVNGTLYYYVVSALNGGGESLDSAPAAATPQPPAPGVPTGLTPTPATARSAWTGPPPSGTISSYNVKRGTVSGGPYTTISTLGAVTSPAYLDSTAVNGTTYYYVVSAVNGGGQGPDSAQAAATPDLSATYVALTPARLLDSRLGNGLSGTFSDGVPRTFQVTGRGGVPSNAVAVTGNLTVTNQTNAGYVFLGPNPTANPTSSTLYFPVGDNRATGVTLGLGAGGTLSATYVAGMGTTDLVFDVTGYFVPDLTGATYVALTPARLLDSRLGNGLSGTFSDGVPRTFQVTGRGGVPSNAVAVTGNLTVTNQTWSGYVFLGPNPTANPTSSTLNFPVGDNRANEVTVALGAGGTLSATYVAGMGTTDLVFDVTGYFVPDLTGATYVALTPARLLDSRLGNGLSGTFSDGVPRTFQVTGRGGVPSNAVAVTGNLTVTNQTWSGYVFLGPNPTANPTSRRSTSRSATTGPMGSPSPLARAAP